MKIDSPSGELVSLDGEVLHAILERAYAPGAPITIAVEGMSIDAKTVGSKRRDDGRFDVRLRLRNLRRDHRELLARTISSPARSERPGS